MFILPAHAMGGRKEDEMKKVEIGDEVTVSMSSNNAFQWMGSPHFDATVLYIPNDTGDLFHLEVPGVGTVLLNPNSSDFIGMTIPHP